MFYGRAGEPQGEPTVFNSRFGPLLTECCELFALSSQQRQVGSSPSNRDSIPRRTSVETETREGDSPVLKRSCVPTVFNSSTTGLVKPRGNPARLCAKAKYFLVTDSELVP